MARRPRSLSLSLSNAATADGPILRTEVLNALTEIGVDKDEIEGIEATWKKRYFIVFKSYTQRRVLLNKCLEIRGEKITMEHPDPRTQEKRKTRVRIYNYPLDEGAENLEKVLQAYGDFTKGTIKDLVDRSCGIKNGVKEIYVAITKAIPSYVQVGKNQVRIDYQGQSATCRKCHKIGHLGKDCTQTVTCRACGGNDHFIKDCPEVICFQCGGKGHKANQCFDYDIDEQFPALNAEKNQEETRPEERNEARNEDETRLDWSKDPNEKRTEAEKEKAAQEQEREEKEKTTQEKEREEKEREEKEREKKEREEKEREEKEREEEKEKEGKEKEQNQQIEAEKNGNGGKDPKEDQTSKEKEKGEDQMDEDPPREEIQPQGATSKAEERIEEREEGKRKEAEKEPTEIDKEQQKTPIEECENEEVRIVTMEQGKGVEGEEEEEEEKEEEEKEEKESTGTSADGSDTEWTAVGAKGSIKRGKKIEKLTKKTSKKKRGQRKNKR